MYNNTLRVVKHNSFYEDEVSLLSSIDSILNYDSFVEYLHLFKSEQKLKPMMTPSDVFWENKLYGYYNELVKYSGCVSSVVPYIGKLEHGIRFGSARWNYINTRISYGCQGPKRTWEIRNVDGLMPIFILGPYIHYSNYYYKDEEQKTVKNKLGKTLLVFPSHSWHGDMTRNSGPIYIDRLIKDYSNKFDTILACVYWNDFDALDIRLLQDNGFKLVSAGFTRDPNFCPRLKSIISLSDYVVGNDIGTNIGYCLYMGKQFELLDCPDRIIRNDPVFEANYQRFKEAFSKEPDAEFTPVQFEKQRTLYQAFWGGDDYIYSKEDLAIAFNLIKKLCRDMHYWTNKKEKVIIQYLNREHPLTDKEYSILCRLLQKE